MKQPLVILTGPTAVGKTEISIKLAKAIHGEIISADSMQVYKYMDIGTAKIMPNEMDGVNHYLVDVLEPSEDFNVVRFQQMAKDAMKEIYSRGHIPIIVGGTGFYIQSILYDIDFTENDGDNSYRHELESISKEKGIQYLHDMLEKIDPLSAKTIHANNSKRVIRALEFYHQTGELMSKHNEEQHQNESPYHYVYFVLNNDRDVLYERINKRIDMMFQNGLVDEVELLKAKGYHKSMVSMQGLGYKEIFDYLNGEITLDDAKTILKRDTRHFAKRQISWFKREKDVTWMNYPDYHNNSNQMLDDMINMISERKIV